MLKQREMQINSIFQNPLRETCVPFVLVKRAAAVPFALPGHEKDLRSRRLCQGGFAAVYSADILHGNF